jgi:hypothetical protein
LEVEDYLVGAMLEAVLVFQLVWLVWPSWSHTEEWYRYSEVRGARSEIGGPRWFK